MGIEIATAHENIGARRVRNRLEEPLIKGYLKEHKLQVDQVTAIDPEDPDILEKLKASLSVEEGILIVNGALYELLGEELVLADKSKSSRIIHAPKNANNTFLEGSLLGAIGVNFK